MRDWLRCRWTRPEDWERLAQCVVLVHGGMWDRRMWDDQFTEFAERHLVVRYDLRGFGSHQRPATAPAWRCRMAAFSPD